MAPPRPCLRAGPQKVECIRKEADILRRLSHPHIVELIDFFESATMCHIVEELLEGGELLDKIMEIKYYTENAALLLVGNIVATIKYMHDASICHRDIKPGVPVCW